MKKFYTFFVWILIYQSNLIAQDTFNWKNYLPEQKIDSIVFLSPIKTEPYQLSQKDSIAMANHKLIALDVFHKQIKEFHYNIKEPITKQSEYLRVYEIKKTISNTDTIKSVVELLPKKNCEEVIGDRCPPKYRDCAIFYAKGKIVYAIKICFSCDYIQATPDSQAGRCLGNKEHIYKINDKWIELGLYDLYERNF